MAFLDKINVNVGTEANPSFVLHDIHDVRANSTAVTTATHLLATDANLSAINPMTIANAASVLGGFQTFDYNTDLDTIRTTGKGLVSASTPNVPKEDYGVLDTQFFTNNGGTFGVERIQFISNLKDVYQRVYWNGWNAWTRCDNFGCNTPADLASLLGGALLTRRTRLTDFDLAVLKQAVADQNLEKYGLRVGDQKTINGYTYVIADLNTMKGTSTPYRLTQNHVGLIVIPHVQHAWNSSGRTDTGADSRGAGYKNCDLHDYLKNTVLPHAKNDLGADNLLAHSKLLTNAVNANGYNRFGSNGGCSSSWEWVSDQYISALSEVQVYGSTIWSSSGYDTGEACRQLEVFKKYSHTEIFGNEYPWLRDIASVDYASSASDNGCAAYNSVSDSSFWVAGLLLFH